MIVTDNPKMIEFTKNGNGSSSGDAFLIATAIAHNLSIITEEKKIKSGKFHKFVKHMEYKHRVLVTFGKKKD